MRIRSIRPEFWSSQDVAALDWETRLVFIGLWSYVDDNGVGRDVERLIVAELFPLDDDLTEASRRVHGALKLLSDGGQITRYTVGGKPYLHVTAFATHQVINRPSKGRYPLPTSENAELAPMLTDDSVSPHPTPGDGEGEKGRRGEVTTSSGEPDKSDTDGFAEFWVAYPRKIARAAAIKAWKAATRKAKPEDILAALHRYRFSPDPQYVPHAATWLNQERWTDQPDTGLRQLHPGEEPTFTQAQLEEILGPDSWSPPAPPPEVDPEVDAAAYRRWHQHVREQHRAERVREALAAVQR